MPTFGRCLRHFESQSLGTSRGGCKRQIASRRHTKHHEKPWRKCGKWSLPRVSVCVRGLSRRFFKP